MPWRPTTTGAMHLSHCQTRRRLADVGERLEMAGHRSTHASLTMRFHVSTAMQAALMFNALPCSSEIATPKGLEDTV